MPFFDIHISQGNVATCLKRSGIVKHEFVANLLLSRLVKKILRIGWWLKLWPRVWCRFFDSRCMQQDVLRNAILLSLNINDWEMQKIHRVSLHRRNCFVSRLKLRVSSCNRQGIRQCNRDNTDILVLLEINWFIFILTHNALSTTHRSKAIARYYYYSAHRPTHGLYTRSIYTILRLIWQVRGTNYVTKLTGYKLIHSRP